MRQPDERSLLELFAEVMPQEQWQKLQSPGMRSQIYTLPVVVEMMLLQRMSKSGSQQEAVHQIVVGQLDHHLSDCKRVRAGKISLNTGSYARACGRTSLAVLKKVCDQALGELGKRIEPEPEVQVPLLLLDGSSLQVEHVSELLGDFPPGHNQHGEGHWGIVKWVALHDLQTGLALRPAWGAMYGQQAVSEQQLAEEALERAPAHSVIMGDAGFGLFSFAYAVVQKQHQVLFRLSKQQARSFGELQAAGDRAVVWRPSLHVRKKHPEWPADVGIQGRLITVHGSDLRETLYLFTTLPAPWEKIVAWYSKRWNMELDLRTLKGTMRLRHLRGKSTEAVEKELLIAVVAYGLVRAFMALAARQAGLPPRTLSFTRAYSLLNIMSGELCTGDQHQREQAYDRVLKYIAQSKLPHRSEQRSYPRAVWGSGKYFPARGQNTSAQSK